MYNSGSACLHTQCLPGESSKLSVVFCPERDFTYFTLLTTLSACLTESCKRPRSVHFWGCTTTFKERRIHVIAMMHTRKWLSEGMFGSPRSTLVSEPITLNGDACLAHLSSAQHKMRDFRLQWLAKMTVSGKLKHRALKWAMVDSTDGTQCFCTVYDPLQPSNCSEGDLWPP